jgi:hypothetical protein
MLQKRLLGSILRVQTLPPPLRSLRFAGKGAAAPKRNGDEENGVNGRKEAAAAMKHMEKFDERQNVKKKRVDMTRSEPEKEEDAKAFMKGSGGSGTLKFAELTVQKPYQGIKDALSKEHSRDGMVQTQHDLEKANADEKASRETQAKDKERQNKKKGWWNKSSGETNEATNKDASNGKQRATEKTQQKEAKGASKSQQIDDKGAAKPQQKVDKAASKSQQKDDKGAAKTQQKDDKGASKAKQKSSKTE